MILQLHSSTYRIFKTAIFTVFTEFKNHDPAIISMNIQKVTITIQRRRRIILKQDQVDKAIFNDRNNSFKLFADQKVLASAGTLLIDNSHGFFQCSYNFFPISRLGQIFNDTKVNSFLGKGKFVIGRHDNKLTFFIKGPNLTDRVNAFDAGHLNIHKCNVRYKLLSNFDSLSTGLGGTDIAGFAKVLINNKFQRVQNNSFVIYQ